jgi:uncharacterized sodium:solute symporter family permease YidK
MMEWFKSGGFGMFALLAVGAGSIGYGVKAVIDPTAERLAALRSLPGVLLTMALFSFGTGLWAVNQALSSEAFMKAHDVTEAQRPVIAILGVTEASQCITLGALLAFVTYVLRSIAETKRAKSSG